MKKFIASTAIAGFLLPFLPVGSVTTAEAHYRPVAHHAAHHVRAHHYCHHNNC